MLSRLVAARPVLAACRNGTATLNAGTSNSINLNSVRLQLLQFSGRDGLRQAHSQVGRRSGAFRRQATLKERLMEPTSGLPFAIGRGTVMVASAFGLGALCFYGAGLGREAGAWEQSIGWDQIVRDRIRSTYLYFGGSLAVSAASAVAVFRNERLLALVTRNSIPAMLITMAALIGTGMVTRSIPYQEGLGAKQLAWLTHSAMVGALIAPLSVVGGQLLLRAAFSTAGIVASLSAIAVSAPSDKFLTWGGPLAIGCGAVLAANIASLFLPPTSAIGAGMYSIVLYGGLVLFSAFLLYDTQKIIERAKSTPSYGGFRPFDPVNESMGIYLDTINIFMRMVVILSGGNRKR